MRDGTIKLTGPNDQSTTSESKAADSFLASLLLDVPGALALLPDGGEEILSADTSQ